MTDKMTIEERAKFIGFDLALSVATTNGIVDLCDFEDVIQQALIEERRIALEEAASAVSYGKCADEIRQLIQERNGR